MPQRAPVRVLRSTTPPGLRNDSNSEGTRSAKDILLQLDPNFSRAVGILNKYMPTEESASHSEPRESASYDHDELNQNKAIGTDSELNSLSHGNTRSESNMGRNRPESEQRGGSTMSDLHNTEYMDDSKDMKTKTSPYVKSVSSRTTDGPTTQKSPMHTRPAKSGVKSYSGSDGPSTTRSDSRQPRPKKYVQRAGSYPRSPPQSSSEGSRRAESEEDQGRLLRQLTHDEDDSEDYDSNYSDGLIDPHPSALRDLDNASPKTIALCKRHQCHYCFFVYFPSTSVDEDILPFRRKAFTDKVSRLQNQDHVREVKATKCARDAFSDRRVRCIERQSGTQIRLSELNPNMAFLKGLPRRRLTIAGPSFANIGCALNIFEVLMPKVIKNALFPYRLPHGASTRFSAGNRVSSTHQWTFGKSDGTVTLRQQIDDKGGWKSFLTSRK